MSGLPIAQHVPSTSEEMRRSTNLALSRACHQVFCILFMHYWPVILKLHRCRMVTDLNLHLPMMAKPLNENHAQEMLNRTWVWMNCLNIERSTASQYGKPLFCTWLTAMPDLSPYHMDSSMPLERMMEPTRIHS